MRRAFTLMRFAEPYCSLMITKPPGNVTFWFGAPVTATADPLMERPSMIDQPLLLALNDADACAITKSAEIALPPTVRLKFASDASESTSSGQLNVAALRTSPLSKDGMLVVSKDASRSSLGPASVPVSARKEVVP